ncbi:MAG: hypothetical protein GF411_15035 [Candidatus Lokiarchaeota archaeon]|nr:hypothetical protein [Candidatus Lokiarchaeota archaeon]
MELLLYGIVFWVFAVLSTVLKTITKEAATWRTIIKVTPAILGVIFVFLNRPFDTIFYSLLMIALAFCALGDAGMEVNILPGLGLFLISHIIYTLNFLTYGFSFGIGTIPIALLFISVSILMVYIFFYQRYLKTADEPAQAEMLRAVIFYAFAISLTLSSSLFLWMSSGIILGSIPFIGAVSFVISDSLIGIREFHHSFRFAEPIILTTYYLAIFLLSMSVLVY